MKAQLNVRLDQALVQQAQKAAKKEGRTLAACVAMALERWLAAASSAPPEPLLTSRLDDLEKRLERLEQQEPLAMHGGSRDDVVMSGSRELGNSQSYLLRRLAQYGSNQHTEPEGEDVPMAPPKRGSNQQAYIPQSGEAITTKALADLLQMRRGTLNARIARAGGALPGLVIEGWCCLGTQVPKRGGPAQALWQQS
jgi:antitoxin component of RelBE/YafQ-DinJ toxin-antitoxin module